MSGTPLHEMYARFAAEYDARPVPPAQRSGAWGDLADREPWSDETHVLSHIVPGPCADPVEPDYSWLDDTDGAIP